MSESKYLLTGYMTKECPKCGYASWPVKMETTGQIADFGIWAYRCHYCGHIESIDQYVQPILTEYAERVRRMIDQHEYEKMQAEYAFSIEVLQLQMKTRNAITASTPSCAVLSIMSCPFNDTSKSSNLSIHSLRLKLHTSRKPVTPSRDWRMWFMLAPSVISAIGFCCFAVLSLAFTEIRQLPIWIRHALIIIGGICVAVGGELGTPAVTIEVFRKWKNNNVVRWDWITLVISAFATLAEFLVAFAALLVTVQATDSIVWTEPSVWAPWTEIWGPIVIGLLAAADAYAGFSELGMYLGDYDRRMEEWIDRLEDLEVSLNGHDMMDSTAQLGVDAVMAWANEPYTESGLHPAVKRAIMELGHD